MNAPRVTHGLLSRLVHVERSEVAALLWSFAYFFCVLCGYYILRPLRDTMGASAGLDRLTWMFTATFLVMLAVVPLFGWLSSRLPRARLLPAVYLFFALNLAIFSAALRFGVSTLTIGLVYFVWVTVFNLFVVSVFWSFMADLYTTEQARRLYGFISAGGSAGAITGPLVTASLVDRIGAPNLLLVSAALLLGAVLCVRRLSAWAGAHEADRQAARGEPIGGGVWAGLTTVARSPYLLAICAYLLCFTLLSTLLYLQQAELVNAKWGTRSIKAAGTVAAASAAAGAATGATTAGAVAGAATAIAGAAAVEANKAAEAERADEAEADKTAYFAGVDLAVNILTLLLQVLVFGWLARSVSTAAMLAIMPVLSVVGFLVLGAVPLLAVLVAFGVPRRAVEFALTKPTRETLFNPLSREEKYKSKNFIDTVVHRGGDALAGWLSAGLRAGGASFAAISLAGAMLAALWIGVALHLGRRHDRLQVAHDKGTGTDKQK